MKVTGTISSSQDCSTQWLYEMLLYMSLLL